MKTVESLEKEIQDLSRFRDEVTGTPTEVYSRIVGYYRSVRNWNKGKKEEYGERLSFNPAQGTEKKAHEAGDASHYLFFHKTSCPNCPPVKNILAGCQMEGTAVSVDTEHGMSKAMENNVHAAPTVIFFNEKGKETSRFHKADDLEMFIGA